MAGRRQPAPDQLGAGRLGSLGAGAQAIGQHTEAGHRQGEQGDQWAKNNGR